MGRAKVEAGAGGNCTLLGHTHTLRARQLGGGKLR